MAAVVSSRAGVSSATRPNRLATGWQERMDEVERPFHAAFQRFVTTLPSATRPLFMFFTGGKLHLADRALSYLSGQNVVLIGSALSGAEVEWLRERHRLPLFTVPIRVDGNTAWELLFSGCQQNFAWVDSDCFVFDPSLPGQLFQALDADPEHTAVAGTFVFGPVELISTPFAAVNTQVLRRIRAEIGDISPSTYSYVNTPLGRTVPHAVSRLVSPVQRMAMGRAIPLDRRGRPLPPQEGILDAYGDGAIFPTTWRDTGWVPQSTRDSGRLHVILDTLVTYQLVALGLGYRLRPVLRIGNYLGLEGVQGCAQVLHVGGVASYSELPPDALGAWRVGTRLAHRMRRAREVNVALLSDFVVRGSPAEYGERLSALDQTAGNADERARAAVVAELTAAGITGFLR